MKGIIKYVFLICSVFHSVYILKKLFFNVYLFLTESESESESESKRESMSRGGAEREGDTESEAGSRL